MKKCVQYVAALAGALSLFAVTASADTLGAGGAIKEVSMNSTSSDDYPLYHGYIVVKSKVDTVRYNWGGSYCPGLSLHLEEDRAILGALIDYARSQVRVLPAFKVGQGGNLCLVGVTAVVKN